QARKYRELGLEYQRMGNLAEALSFYQKAIAMYPDFAVVYNDIGVVYEAMGSLEQAEENYLKSVRVDPNYPGAYTNLALYYEGQRNLKKAVFYWGKRVEVGISDDPQTQKAVNRLVDIRSSLSDQASLYESAEEVLVLMNDVDEDKAELDQEKNL
ncbi:MAG: tetratricopeptide repeat protein, partial [Candidatus Omnitrophota bacterium]